MSNFAVTIETIGDIREHTNADRLEMATLAGKDYDFVVLKGQFQVDDVVVYFPVDSILPEWITDALQLTGKLSGKEKNRVKTIKLRGNISQGVVCSREQLQIGYADIAQANTGADVTEALGVEKYEPSIIPSQYGDLRPLPNFVYKYDVEGAQNHIDVVEQLMNEPVFITEKLEGSHWSVTWYPESQELIVSQRNYRIEPNDNGEHDWHKVVRRELYQEKLQKIADRWTSEYAEVPGAVTIRGEMVGPGVQANYYKLPDHTAYIFEIEINGIPLAPAQFMEIAESLDLQTVPILAFDMRLRDWLDGLALKQASDGKSEIANVPREGIIIKPMIERKHEQLGRVFLKQRSPIYLAKSDF